MYGELFEYCCADCWALLLLLRVRSTATVGGQVQQAITKPSPREETLLPDVGRGRGCYEYSSVSVNSKHSSSDVVEHTQIFWGDLLQTTIRTDWYT